MQHEALAVVQIKNQLAKIAYLSDQGTPEDYLACFTDDAVWDLAAAEGLPMQAVKIIGRKALHEGIIERRKSGIQGPGSHTAHAISTTSVEVAGNTATAISIFMFYTSINRVPKLTGMGRYRDTFIATDQGWLLKTRNITRD